VRDEEVALFVETHAVGFARDLAVAFRGEVCEDSPLAELARR
jgi:hypothetical protein